MFSSTLTTLWLLDFFSLILIVTAGPTNEEDPHHVHPHRAFHHDDKVSRTVQPELRTPVRRKTCSYVPRSIDTSTSASANTATSSSAVASSSATDISTIDMLFPVSQEANASWSTYSQAVNPLPLSDATFNETHDMTALVHNYTDAPDGTYSLGVTSSYQYLLYLITHHDTVMGHRLTIQKVQSVSLANPWGVYPFMLPDQAAST
jgi:hypothetical protein